MKIVRVNLNTSVFFSDGTFTQRDLTNEEFEKIQNASEEEIKEIMYPDYKKKIQEYNDFLSLEERINNSVLLTKKGDSVYWEEVSELSMPKELIEAVIEAEENEDSDKLTAYKNFWVLMSLNPDSRCRQNLFWFLKKYGMTISQYGLFVGYRNADVKQRGDEEELYSRELIKFVKESYTKVKNQKQSPKRYLVGKVNNNYTITKYNEYMQLNQSCLLNLYTYFNERNWDYDLINPNVDTVYTDHHSHTFTIKIGEKVSMDRKECDSKQENTCSTGLHIGGASWLSQNYFGDTGLVCLINPADVVAVPPYDNYGKLRTCAYLPIGVVKFDSEGKVIPYNFEDGFKSEYVKDIIYSGTKSIENEAAYSYNCPDIPELKANIVSRNLKEIAQQAIMNKVK